MSQGNPKIWLVSSASPQTQLFLTYLTQHLRCQVANLAPQELPGLASGKRALVLLDSNHVDKLQMLLWHEEALNEPLLTIAAFNLADEEQASDLLASLHLQGIFYSQDDLVLICKGIGALLRGEWWLSRSLMARLVHFYRDQQISAFNQTAGLTQREAEVLRLLGSGASNLMIADILNVSDHTVKTHLYNLFRKLKVHNRFQAVDWARNRGEPAAALYSRKAGNG